jgi:outer membrane biosynthesis protein TonB
MSANTLILSNEEKHRRAGLVVSIVVHVLVLLLFLLPFIRFPVPPPGQQGILVSLGVPDQGEGDDRPETQNMEVVEPQPVAQPPEPSQPTLTKQTPQERKVLTSEDAEAMALRQKQQEERRREQEELDRQRRAEAKARKDAEEEARLKAEAEAKKQAEYEETKKQYGTLLSGSGKGNTGTPGNQGTPTGDPNAANLEGVSTGSGMVGGGLGSRGVRYEPTITDNSQKTGRVVLNVCVNKAGQVISADYTQRGSTTTDTDLRTLAERSAREFVFTESAIEKQCGTITIDFKVR